MTPVMLSNKLDLHSKALDPAADISSRISSPIEGISLNIGVSFNMHSFFLLTSTWGLKLSS